MTPGMHQVTNQEAEELYDRHVKPLEAKHQGEYVAVSRSGKTIFARSLLEALEKGSSAFGPENVVFKVGQRVVGKWR